MHQGFTVQTKNSTITFYNETNYKNYLDYLQNGLKIIRKSGYSYHFNDGSRFLNMPSQNGLNQVRILRDRNNKQFKNERYFRKHLQLICNYK